MDPFKLSWALLAVAGLWLGVAGHAHNRQGRMFNAPTQQSPGSVLRSAGDTLPTGQDRTGQDRTGQSDRPVERVTRRGRGRVRGGRDWTDWIGRVDG
jgi:hypothetical protein